MLDDALSDSDEEDSPEEQDMAALSQSVKAELESFRRSNELPASGACIPLIWWKQHHKSFPLLAELARMILDVPSSQIECERVFSLTGIIIKVTSSPECIEIYRWKYREILIIMDKHYWTRGHLESEMKTSLSTD